MSYNFENYEDGQIRFFRQSLVENAGILLQGTYHHSSSRAQADPAPKRRECVCVYVYVYVFVCVCV
jgi:hypothetical protein